MARAQRGWAVAVTWINAVAVAAVPLMLLADRRLGWDGLWRGWVYALVYANVAGVPAVFLFRQSRFLSAVDFVQADRFRRLVAGEMARIFGQVDVLLVPSLRDEMLTISNHTGHPSLTLRAGFVEVGQARSDWAPDPARPLPTFSPKRRVPHGVTLIGRLFDEGLLGRVGIALEKAFNVADERPPGF